MSKEVLRQDCFHVDDVVVLASGQQRFVRDVRAGDVVRTASGGTTRVLCTTKWPGCRESCFVDSREREREREKERERERVREKKEREARHQKSITTMQRRRQHICEVPLAIAAVASTMLELGNALNGLDGSQHWMKTRRQRYENKLRPTSIASFSSRDFP